ncbi:MAG: chorismate mutase [Proteobacteria bacterium]|nr:chorismate mutase [Burkholderiales bacterium]
MKPATACENLSDIRAACDEIDREIVRLLGTRMPYVREAVRFKQSEQDIRQPDKMPTFMRARRDWAQAESLDPGFVEHLYQVLVDHSFDVQLALWQRRAK